MNAAVFSMGARRAVSPYARRLAREGDVVLAKVAGSGPGGRIVAADILTHRSQAAAIPAARPIASRAPVLTFSAVVSLAGFCRLATEAAGVGLDIPIEDTATRAAQAALSTLADKGTQGIAIEADGRQVMISTASDRSIRVERRLRLEALDRGADVSAEPATASLLVLHSARVAPVGLPLLPGRAARFVLAVDGDREQAHALFCADGDVITETQAVAVLEAFAAGLEKPLALLA